MSINALHALRMMPNHADGSSTTLVAGLLTSGTCCQLVVLASGVPASRWSGMTDAAMVELARLTRKAKPKQTSMINRVVNYSTAINALMSPALMVTNVPHRGGRPTQYVNM